MEELKDPKMLEQVEQAKKAFEIIANLPESQKNAVVEGLTAAFDLVGLDPYKLGERVVAIDGTGEPVTLPGAGTVW